MSLTLTGTGGIFTVFGPAFNAMDALNTARGTTIPPLTKAFQDAYQAGYDALPGNSQYWEIAMQGVPQGELGWQAAGSTYTSSLISALQQLLQQHVSDDTDATGQSFTFAMEYLIADMIANSQTVEENTVSSTGVTSSRIPTMSRRSSVRGSTATAGRAAASASSVVTTTVDR